MRFASVVIRAWELVWTGRCGELRGVRISKPRTGLDASRSGLRRSPALQTTNIELRLAHLAHDYHDPHFLFDIHIFISGMNSVGLLARSSLKTALRTRAVSAANARRCISFYNTDLAGLTEDQTEVRDNASGFPECSD